MAAKTQDTQTQSLGQQEFLHIPHNENPPAAQLSLSLSQLENNVS